MIGEDPIENLYAYGNLNLKNIDIDFIRPILREFNVSSPELSYVDVGGCSKLEYLEMQDGFFFGGVNLDGCSSLEILRCQNSWMLGE